MVQRVQEEMGALQAFAQPGHNVRLDARINGHMEGGKKKEQWFWFKELGEVVGQLLVGPAGNEAESGVNNVAMSRLCMWYEI